MSLLFTMKNKFRRYIFPEKEILSSLKNIIGTQPLSILDVGCGSGWFLAKVLEIAPPNSYGVGIEVDSRYFSSAALGDGKKMIIQGENSLNKEQFDLVMFNDVLHHIPEKKTFLLRFLDRVTKSGYILVKDMLADHTICKHWNRLHDRILSGDKIRETSRAELREIIPERFTCIYQGQKRILLYDHFWCIYKNSDNISSY